MEAGIVPLLQGRPSLLCVYYVELALIADSWGLT